MLIAARGATEGPKPRNVTSIDRRADLTPAPLLNRSQRLIQRARLRDTIDSK